MSPELQILVYLLVLIGIVAAGYFVKRYGFDFIQARTRGEKRLEICETRMLGNRQFLIVASYDSQKVLLGVSPGKIDLLCRLEGGGASASSEKAFEALLEEESER